MQRKPTPPRQPEVNIGTIGHVDHGKTTLVEALTGVWASRHSEELKRGITIKLGYADAAVFRCPKCESPRNYSTDEQCQRCGSKGEFVRALSFVDAPGHEALMATMLSGAAVMDGVILVIAADERCPQPQTREHLAAIEIIGINKIVIAQNKIDLVDRHRALESYMEIKKFVEGTVAEEAPIIPLSAQNRINVDLLLYAVEHYIPTPVREATKPPRMYVVRSFDINKPGTSVEDLVGGVIGGTIIQGSFKVGDEIEIRPGISGLHGKERSYEPLFTRITSLHTGGRNVEEAYCGGLVGVGTLLDPSLTKADGLVGNVVGRPETLPETRFDLSLEFHLFERVVGTKEMSEVKNLNNGEELLLDVGTAPTIGRVENVRGDKVEMKLSRPVCAEDSARVAISRRIAGRWRLIGFGIIR
ncbi:MAG: translation initiation factor IF-2 subunit gamma [Nitrososphaerota archaeon]|nr:translation initiation factor IF-2 subunit gamma [Candidatus Bathyarchaeota archaeon]MDW8048143.1 translation initiation factor IF-2 subunit gamma [Nitrososphaerota archaeon]